MLIKSVFFSGLIALLLFWSVNAQAQFTPFDESKLELIYVSPMGNDNNAGTTVAPFKTIKKALSTASAKKRAGTGEDLGYTGWSVCGVKFYSTTAGNKNITVLRSEAIDNRSTGFWWDTGNHDCQLIECTTLRNSTNGTFIEANNSVGNNFENPGTGMTGTTGIASLTGRYTVNVVRCIIADTCPWHRKLSYNEGKRSLFLRKRKCDSRRLFDLQQRYSNCYL